MDVITLLLVFCLCVANFFMFIINAACLVFLIRLSYFLVRMFDYMKELGVEEEEDWAPSAEPTSGLVDLPNVGNYAHQNLDE